MIQLFKFLLFFAVCIVFVTFSIVNRGPVALDLFPLPYEAQMPLFLFALICMALGVVVASLGANLSLFRAKHRLKQEQRRSAVLEKKLDDATAAEHPLAHPQLLSQ